MREQAESSTNCPTTASVSRANSYIPPDWLSLELKHMELLRGCQTQPGAHLGQQGGGPDQTEDRLNPQLCPVHSTRMQSPAALASHLRPDDGLQVLGGALRRRQGDALLSVAAVDVGALDAEARGRPPGDSGHVAAAQRGGQKPEGTFVWG